MSQTTLLSLTKDEAVVAEKVTTYRREEITKQAEVLSAQVDADNARLPQLKKEIQEIEQRLAANSYALELYRALLEQFNKQYPEVAEPAVENDSEKAEPTKEDVGEVEEVVTSAGASAAESGEKTA